MFTTCKREKAEWDVDIVAPIATASLSVEDIAPDGYIIADGSGAMKVVYQNTVYTLPIDSLLRLPDTTLTYPVIIPFSPGPLAPGTTIPIPFTQNINFKIDPAKLTRIVINQGILNLRIKSSAGQPMLMNYTVPKAFKNGSPLNIVETLPAMVGADSGEIIRDYDLAGYDLALTGPTGSQTNILKYDIGGAVSQDATGPLNVLAGQRLFNFYSSFKDLKPEYVEGYFGNKSTTVSDTAKLNLLKNIVAGTLDLEDINLNITFENSIGADVRATIVSLKGRNTTTGTTVALSHPIINSPVNIDRATNLGYGTQQNPYITTQKSFVFNPTNSNITQFISNLPDEYEYKVNLLLNPLGNISGGNDFIYRNAGIKINVNLELPLSFKSNNLTLVDTIDYNINAKQEDIDRYQGGSYKLFALNGFPLDATAQLLLMDEWGNVIDTLLSSNTIAAADVDGNYKAIGQKPTLINFPISASQAQNLVNTKKVIVRVAFTTQPANQYLKLYNTYKFDLKLTSDFKFRMKL